MKTIQKIHTITITSESGTVLWSKVYYTENQALNDFNFIKGIKSPQNFNDLRINATDYYAGGGNIGCVRLIENGYNIKNEFFRNA